MFAELPQKFAVAAAETLGLMTCSDEEAKDFAFNQEGRSHHGPEPAARQPPYLEGRNP